MSADDKPAQYNNIYTNDIKELKLNPGVIYFKEYTTRGNPSLPVLQKILQKLVDTGYGYIKNHNLNGDIKYTNTSLIVGREVTVYVPDNGYIELLKKLPDQEQTCINNLEVYRKQQEAETAVKNFTQAFPYFTDYKITNKLKEIYSGYPNL